MHDRVIDRARFIREIVGPAGGGHADEVRRLFRLNEAGICSSPLSIPITEARTLASWLNLRRQARGVTPQRRVK